MFLLWDHGLLFLNYYNLTSSVCSDLIFHQVPQQKNDSDCGLFVLFFMERFIEEAPERLKKKDLAMVQFFFILEWNAKNYFFLWLVS
jgi:hypothetical protein